MRILVLSFYYRPDLSAGSFRATALVEALRGLVAPGSAVDVVTTLPNRYHSFVADAPAREDDGVVTVTRLVLPTHRSGMLDQSKAFVAFARQAARVVEEQKYDVVFATSSRLMTAALGAWVARRTDARLYLDIRDIFVDTLKDVAHWAVARGTQPLFSALERWTIGSAATVNLVSAGFGDYFRSRYPGRRFTYFTNGIDDEFLVAARAVQPSAPTIANRPLTVLYAGNIGEGQGLHSILPGLANALGSRVRFQVVGDGGKRRVLEQALAAGRATSVELLAPVGRTELLELYRAADVLFLHLNDHDAFKKVLPSKIFEYAALGKPVWAGVAGYAAEFLRSEVKNSAVFQPCDVQDAVRSLQGLTIGDAARSEFVARYSRARITLELALDVVHVGAGGP